MHKAKLISGTLIANDIKVKLQQDVKDIAKLIPNFRPGLTIVQVGGRKDSDLYIKMKLKAAEEIGIAVHHLKIPSTVTQSDLLEKIEELNNDTSIHGIIVQMPLDCVNKIDSHLVTNAVAPEKDVDGLHTLNEGRIALGDLKGFIPCTPNGCMELIKSTGIQIAGAKAVVLGRSKIIGTPVSELLKWEHATVTICHTKTRNVANEIKLADIVIAAAGSPEMIKGSWIKPGAVVIDCGINVIPDSTKKSGTRLVGDVCFSEVESVASFLTPVPGGVGPMTVAMLMKNTVQSAENALKRLLSKTWNLIPLPLNVVSPVPSDIEIAQSQITKNISNLAIEIGLEPNEVSLYGNKKAKISLSSIQRLENRKPGKLIVVAGITPTPLGEGKSTTTIGLVQALCAHVSKNAIACLRQPSQGPTFGIKGGAAGGGFSQVVPMEDFNLHLTGDIHAITAANNLLAAQLDTRMFHELTQSDDALYSRLVPKIKGERKFSKIQLKRLDKLNIKKDDPNSLTKVEITQFVRLDINPNTIMWSRVLDVNDRYLRKITIGQSPTEKNFTRQTEFTISVASEIMAVLALSKNLKDMKERLGNMVVGFSNKGEPVTADDLGITGALCVLLKDTIEPTLMQTLEGTPVLVHTGPFANIAHGCSSIIADEIALKLVGEDGYCVTEAGFGSDIGMEKFFNIKSRASGQIPNVVVLVTTVRALKMHGGGPPVEPGTPLKPEYVIENIELVKKGLPNLLQHINNSLAFNVPVIVAINSHNTDTKAELDIIIKAALGNGALAAIPCTNWNHGGAGAIELANSVISACKTENKFRFLYDVNSSIQDKINIIAKSMYGAGSVEFSSKSVEAIEFFNKKNFDKLPVCMAKTALSLTGDPAIKGAPKGFKINVRDIQLSAGAGFLVAICGEITKMPGLPTRPCFYDIDLNTETGAIEGLF